MSGSAFNSIDHSTMKIMFNLFAVYQTEKYPIEPSIKLIRAFGRQDFSRLFDMILTTELEISKS